MSSNCQNCPNLITVSSVTVSSGVTTITVPSTVSFSNNTCYCLGLFTTIPIGTAGTQISITNGSSTWNVMNKVGNYWRPCCALKSRSLLKVKFYDDPVHFLKA